MTYSQSLAMSRQRYGVGGKNAVAYRNNERTLGPISNTVILIVLACLLGLLYLTQVTKTNAYGYAIEEARTQQSQLKSEKDDLEVASARLRSLDRVQNSGVAQAMVPVSPAATVSN